MTTIKLKNGSGAPLAGDLVAGEPALDLTNKRLYTEDSGGTVIEVGTNPTSLTTGTFTSTGIDDNATSTAITIDASENVGIGTVSPAFKADIAGTLNAQGLQVKGSPSLSFNASNWMTQQETDVARTYICGPDASTYQPWEIYRATSTGNASLTMSLDASGNVGIGKDNPQAKLDVNSGSDELSASISSNATTAYSPSSSAVVANTRLSLFGGNATSSYTGIRFSHGGSFEAMFGAVQDASGTAAFVWNTYNGSSYGERMRITSSGNVGIGTSNPTQKLDISGATPVLAISDTGSAASYGFQPTSGALRLYDFTGAAERLRIDSSGNLLVGATSNPNNYKQVLRYDGGAINGLDIQDQSGSGTRTAIRFNRNGTTQVGSITLGTSTTSYNTSSDARLKENIVDAPAGNIGDIRVRSFDWKSDGSHQTYGMVAQELVEVAPEAVSQGATEDDMWSVDYSKLVPMMIKEIQDLKAEVAALKGE